MTRDQTEAQVGLGCPQPAAARHFKRAGEFSRALAFARSRRVEDNAALPYPLQFDRRNQEGDSLGVGAATLAGSVCSGGATDGGFS
jgi:hypothetical protein